VVQTRQPRGRCYLLPDLCSLNATDRLWVLQHRGGKAAPRARIIADPCSLTSVPCFRERRWSSRTFRYGYLVTTSPQSRNAPWQPPPLRLG